MPRAQAASNPYDVTRLENAPRQKRSQELSLRILTAAEGLLRRSSLEDLTMAGVAAEAGVSIGGLYGRFSNRKELVDAIHTQVLFQVQDDIRSALARPFEDAAQVAETFAVALVDIFEGKGDLLPLFGKPSDHASQARIERGVRECLADALAPFRDQIRRRDPDGSVRILVHLLLASVVRERTTLGDAVDRKMGWIALRNELPKIARLYLLAATD